MLNKLRFCLLLKPCQKWGENEIDSKEESIQNVSLSRPRTNVKKSFENGDHYVVEGRYHHRLPHNIMKESSTYEDDSIPQYVFAAEFVDKSVDGTVVNYEMTKLVGSELKNKDYCGEMYTGDSSSPPVTDNNNEDGRSIISRLSSMSSVTAQRSYISSSTITFKTAKKKKKSSERSSSSLKSEKQLLHLPEQGYNTMETAAEDQRSTARFLYQNRDWYALAQVADEYLMNTNNIPHIEQNNSTLACFSEETEEETTTSATDRQRKSLRSGLESGNHFVGTEEDCHRQISELIRELAPQDAQKIDVMMEHYRGNEKELLKLLQLFRDRQITEESESETRQQHHSNDKSIDGECLDSEARDIIMIEPLNLVREADKAIVNGDWTAVERKTVLMEKLRDKHK